MGLREFDGQIWPLVVAHRGASASQPENTLVAFDAAVAVGADMVELDVRLTADGVPVILHDADVASTTDGQGLVHELTLEQMRRLDASSGRGARVAVPTLAEALRHLSGRVGLDIEIKNLPGEPGFDSPVEAIAHLVVELLAEEGFAGPVLVSSFNWLSIERVKAMAPAIATGFLTMSLIDPRASLVYARSMGHAFVLPQAPALLATGEAFVREAHASGVRVGAWTVDDPPVIEELFAMGVDAVATNRPEVAVPIRDRHRRSDGPSR